MKNLDGTQTLFPKACAQMERAPRVGGQNIVRGLGNREIQSLFPVVPGFLWVFDHEISRSAATAEGGRQFDHFQSGDSSYELVRRVLSFEDIPETAWGLEDGSSVQGSHLEFLWPRVLGYKFSDVPVSV